MMFLSDPAVRWRVVESPPGVVVFRRASFQGSGGDGNPWRFSCRQRSRVAAPQKKREVFDAVFSLYRFFTPQRH
jgi:hypothetical protein